MNTQRAYIPAAGKDWLLPFYDPLVKLVGADRVRRKLFDQAGIRPGDKVLDVGCGTGTLAVLSKRLAPGAEIIGLDPDPKALARAHRKAQRAHVSVQFDEGFADVLPYADASIDRVLSSLMLHHLPTAAKQKALLEVRRVLKPGGSFHLLDFSEPKAHLHRFSDLVHMLHAHQLQDNTEERLLIWMREAGFAQPRITGTGRLMGSITYFMASV